MELICKITDEDIGERIINMKNPKLRLGARQIRAEETVIEGAIRELKEELGVKTKESDLKFISIVKSTKNPKNHEFQYVYLLECNNKVEEYKKLFEFIRENY